MSAVVEKICFLIFDVGNVPTLNICYLQKLEIELMLFFLDNFINFFFYIVLGAKSTISIYYDFYD